MKIIVKNLGPIDYAEMNCGEFTVITGCQSSGKSTLTKVAFLLSTIKDDAYSLIIKRHLESHEITLHKALTRKVKQKFLDIFGTSWVMDPDMTIECVYGENSKVTISLDYYKDRQTISVNFSRNIREAMKDYDKFLFEHQLLIQDDEKTTIKSDLHELFNDDHECVYIPAGRSMITLLATQLTSIYNSMKEEQKNKIDFCTRSYIEHILTIKPEFNDGFIGLLNANPLKRRKNKQLLDIAESLINRILGGTYRYNDGNEILEISNNQYVKINYTSSGQQESLWILYLLFYYLFNGNKVFFIIEEPESHLFPEWQKYITELIALTSNAGHKVVVTTHSPYVLGTINNLILAEKLSSKYGNKVSEIIKKDYFVHNPNSYFIDQKRLMRCIDDETGLIQNELIDVVSGTINNDLERLLDMEFSDAAE